MQSIRFLALLLSAARLFALPLPEDDLARVGLAEDGAPLWRFADHDGVWRYPVSPAEVSPYDLDALLTYEDRRFYRHPGGNPLALGRAARPRVWSSGWMTSDQMRPPSC